jgi:hypothetical protein
MTRLPTDPIDPYEADLARRIRAHTDQAVVPIDATAIAHSAAVDHPRRRFGRLFGATTAVGRLGWIALAGLLAAATIGGIGLSAGSKGPAPVGGSPTFIPTPSPTAAPVAVATPVPTPTSTPVPTPRPIVACVPAGLTAKVISWQGAAGGRIASVRVTNSGAVSCTFPTLTKPELVDGTGAVLLAGAKPGATKTLTLAPGASLNTMADASNYCGPTPVAPVSVALILADGARVVARPVTSSDTSGVPPCNGAGSPGYIQMQAWMP